MPYFVGLQRCTKSFWEKTFVVKVDSVPFDWNGECVHQVPYQRTGERRLLPMGALGDRDMPINWKGVEEGSPWAQRWSQLRGS